MEKIKIILLGNPYSTNNIYARNGRRGFIKAKPKALKESYILQAKNQFSGKKIFSEKIKLEIKIFFADKRKRDIDNFHKLSLDALSGIVYEDDSQIKKMEIEKFYDKENPRIEIFVYEL